MYKKNLLFVLLVGSMLNASVFSENEHYSCHNGWSNILPWNLSSHGCTSAKAVVKTNKDNY